MGDHFSERPSVWKAHVSGPSWLTKHPLDVPWGPLSGISGGFLVLLLEAFGGLGAFGGPKIADG